MSKDKAPTTAREITLQEITRQSLLKPFSDDRPWDEATITVEIRALTRVMDAAFFEAGRRLIFAKNNVPEGHWLQFLDNCGLSRTSAARYMRVSREIIAHPRLRELNMGVSKLDALLFHADPEDLEDFEKSGELFGMDADELNTKSREQLKNLIRDKDKRIEQAKKQVASLQEENERLKGGDEDRPREVYYNDLHELRRVVFTRLDILQSEAFTSNEDGDDRKVIALYNLAHQIHLNCVHRMGALEDKSAIGPILRGTGHGYDTPWLYRTDLGEIAEQEAPPLDTEPVEV